MNKSFISLYSNFYMELINQGISFHIYKRRLLDLKKRVLPNSKEIDIKLDEVFNNYKTNLKNEIKLTLFVINNAKKIDCNAANRLYDKLCLYDENNYDYMCDVFKRLKVALAKENPSYFYIPVNKVDIINDDNYKEFINIAKGFDIQNIKDFICDNDIYNYEKLESVLHKTSFVEYGNDKIGIYNDKLILPIVNDERSALQVIEILVRSSLLDYEDCINDDRVVNSRAIPIYYQMLYKSLNKFIKCDIKKSRLAYILSCNTKKSNNFDYVIKRLKRIKNS